MKACVARDVSSECLHSVRYSICTLVTDMTQYNGMLESFSASGFDEKNSEFLYIDNTQENRFDGFSGTNHFISRAQGEYIIFCHQDVLLIEDDRQRLDDLLTEMDNIDSSWAVLGNAGGVRLGKLAIRISDPKGENTNTGDLPARVKSLDENFFILRKSANLGVSSFLEGFHFYATDLCINADIRGYSAYVIDFHLRHTGGASQNEESRKRRVESFRSGFFGLRRRFIDVYRKAGAGRWIETPNTRFYLSASRARNLVFNNKITYSLVKRFYRLVRR